MAEAGLLCYITDRTAFPGDESARRTRLLEKIGEAARCGVDYVQLREKDLPGRELERLAREVVRVVRSSSKRKTRLLINSRTDVALAVGADGVHLRTEDISPEEVRKVWSRVVAPSAPSGQGLARENQPAIGVSCHSPEEVVQAAAKGADFAVFAPVFEKKDLSGGRVAGLVALQEACRASIPVLALGGMTLQNAESCLNAGAAGIAAIRLFQENNIAEVVRKFRG